MQLYLDSFGAFPSVCSGMFAVRLRPRQVLVDDFRFSKPATTQLSDLETFFSLPGSVCPR